MYKETELSSHFITDKLGIEGKVIQRAECRPIADNNYLKLKRYISSGLF